MTPAQLQAVVALAEHRGFSAAATHMRVTQSAVSHAIGALERELGAEIVARGRGGFGLTEFGGQLLIRARAILREHEALQQEAADTRGLKRGTLRVGSFGPTSSLRLLPVLLCAFRDRYPGITVRIDEEGDDVIDRWLLEGRVEVGFVVLPDERFDTLPMIEDEFVAILPAGHRLAGRSEVSPQALQDEPFILTEAGGAPLVEPLLARHGAAPPVLYRFPQVMSILGFVQQGLAWSIAARLALPEAYPGVVFKPLAPRAPRRVGLAVRNMAELSPAARAFVDVAACAAKAGLFDSRRPRARK